MRLCRFLSRLHETNIHTIMILQSMFSAVANLANFLTIVYVKPCCSFKRCDLSNPSKDTSANCFQIFTSKRKDFHVSGDANVESIGSKRLHCQIELVIVIPSPQIPTTRFTCGFEFDDQSQVLGTSTTPVLDLIYLQSLLLQKSSTSPTAFCAKRS